MYQEFEKCFEDGKYGIITKVETEDLKNKMKDVLDGKIDIKI